MKDDFLKFNSFTESMKAKNTLKKLNINSYIKKISNNHNLNSCGYKLIIKNNFKRAKAALINNNINFIN